MREKSCFIPDRKESLVAIPQHPLNIRPSGNAYTAAKNIKNATGTFSHLPDELLVHVLEYLDGPCLRSLGGSCKALFAFTRLEDLWKNQFILFPPPSFTWHGSWYSSYLGIPIDHVAKISCRNLFSDILHRPFLCIHTPLQPYTSNIPPQNTIPRLFNISADDFACNWVNRPFILTDEVTQWPVYQHWSMETLLKAYSDVKFRAEAVDWPLKTYVDYMNNCSDESPLYLFDRAFVEKMQIQVGKESCGQYWVPQCFGEDYFDVLSDQRPDHRWLIVGPERSGSTFHKDPNATSAWNAVLRGSKYWIMFPTSSSSPPPPGVFISKDESEVTSPLSIAEWLMGFHAEARSTLGCMEGICHAGEVLHVPSGWWHLVINLSFSIAITQNFVPRAHLTEVVNFLKNKPEQVSGFKKEIEDPYELFMGRMGKHHPEVLMKVASRKKRKWDELTKGESGEDESKRKSNRFSFAFEASDDEDVP